MGRTSSSASETTTDPGGKLKSPFGHAGTASRSDGEDDGGDLPLRHAISMQAKAYATSLTP